MIHDNNLKEKFQKQPKPHEVALAILSALDEKPDQKLSDIMDHFQQKYQGKSFLGSIATSSGSIQASISTLINEGMVVISKETLKGREYKITRAGINKLRGINQADLAASPNFGDPAFQT